MTGPRPPALALTLLLLGATLAGCFGSDPPPAPAAETEAPEPVLPRLVVAANGTVLRGGFSNTSVYPGPYETPDRLSRVVRPGPYAIRAPEVVKLASDVDGVDIEIGLTLPEAPAGHRAPVIVVASPYYLPMTPERISGEEKWEGALPHLWLHQEFFAGNYVPHGYAVALVSVRGTAGSGGCTDMLGPLETADIDQAVTWLATQEWSSGRVGMFGLSYSASTPWQVAAKGNPHLATIVAIAGLPSLYHYMHYNGSLHASIHGGFPMTYWPFGWAMYEPSTRGYDNVVDAFACPEFARAMAATEYSATTLEHDPLGFYEAREHRPGVLANYRGSVLAIQGFQDFRVPSRNTYPWIFELEQQGVVVKHLLGQWPHTLPDSSALGPDRRLDFAEILYHWFDYWLKGNSTADLGPRVQVQDNEGRWRSEEAWPPADSVAVTLRLGADGKLAENAGGGEPVALALNPRYVSTPIDPILNNQGRELPTRALPCPACATFATDKLAAALRIAGLPVARLTVTPSGPGGLVTVQLLAQGADGAETVIGRGAADLRYDGEGKTRAVTPGQPIEVAILLEAMDAVIPSGGRLVLVAHAGGYEERLPATPAWPMQLHTDGTGALTFAAFVRGESAFFAPPSG